MPKASACRIDQVLSVIEDKWTLGIIHELGAGPRRTLEILGAFKGLSPRTLGHRLKRLTRSGILTRKSFPESPPRVEWSLTEKGREVLIVVAAIAEVATRWGVEAARDRASECRVCVAAESEQATQRVKQSKPVAEELIPAQAAPHAKIRKRTDVTLL